MVEVKYAYGGDWEVLYIDGEKVCENHLGRLWPRPALEKLDGKEIEFEGVLFEDDFMELADEYDGITTDRDGEQLWGFPDELPDELR